VTCCQCEGIERQFDRKTAQRDLRRLRRRGPPAATRLLIGELERAGVAGATLLDIGGGVGAIHHELLDAGAREAVHVDISPAYLEAARGESERRGHGSRVRFLHGDFVQLAESIGSADVVTLDRVICCYPDMELLVGRSAEKAGRVYGAVYPRDRWWTRLAVGVANGVLRIRRSAFRVFVHAPPAIERVLQGRGFDRRDGGHTFLWEVSLYVRRVP
jgi:magnesium-protoporphyrin O-methyltransferase